jgi:hypothetical protein
MLFPTVKTKIQSLSGKITNSPFLFSLQMQLQLFIVIPGLMPSQSKAPTTASKAATCRAFSHPR